jgi:hypothetical protein
MAIISPILQDYRKKHRIKQVGCFDGNKSKFISLPFNVRTPINGYNYYFDADSSLDGDKVVISEIALVSSTAQARLFTSNGSNSVDNYPSSALNRGSLYICDINQQVVSVLPLSSLCAETNGGKPAFTWFDTQIWANCYILFQTQLTPATSYGLGLRVTYFDKYINA